MPTYRVTVQEDENGLFVDLPAPVIEVLELKPGDTLRWFGRDGKIEIQKASKQE